MATKHTIADSDTYFVVDPASRIIKNASNNKTYLMQYDHNSEELTFEVPRYIESHDMSLCDIIQVHYENKSTGTSVSMRKSYRGIYVIDKSTIVVNEETITFPWLIPENATMFAGSLEFQLKFICYEDTENSIEGYKWHSYVNSDISIVAGLGATESDMTPAATATLKSLEIVELENGIDVILDGEHYPIYHGNSGVYVGSGDMPEGYNVQIDPDGEADSSSMEAVDLTTSIDENSTDDQIPSAKAVWDVTQIKPLKSPDKENPIYFRDIESGYYVMTGYFRPYPNSSSFISMDNMYVSVARLDAGSHVMSISPLNFRVKCYEILVDATADDGFTYQSWTVDLLDLYNQSKAMVTTIDETSDDTHYPTSKAVYTLLDNYSKQVNQLLETIVNGEVTE